MEILKFNQHLNNTVFVMIRRNFFGGTSILRTLLHGKAAKLGFNFLVIRLTTLKYWWKHKQTVQTALIALPHVCLYQEVLIWDLFQWLSSSALGLRTRMTTRRISTRRCTRRRWTKMRTFNTPSLRSPPRITMNVSKLWFLIIACSFSPILSRPGQVGTIGAFKRIRVT